MYIIPDLFAQLLLCRLVLIRFYPGPEFPTPHPTFPLPHTTKPRPQPLRYEAHITTHCVLSHTPYIGL